MNELRVASVSGSAYDRGVAHGEELRDLVALGIAQWKDALGSRTGLPPGDYLAQFLADTDFLPAFERWTPGVVDEIRGIAVGARLSFDDALAYQLADEEWWYSETRGVGRHRAPREQPDGQACSAVGLRRGIGGVPVIAQNMDLPTHFDGTQVALRIDTGSRSICVLTAAGYLGLTGCNDAGVGVCVNTLLSLQRSTTGLPVAGVVRGALQQPDVAGARAFVEGVPHASGQNYLLGDPTGLIDLEAGANQVAEFTVDGSVVWHTNHPLVNDARNDGQWGNAPIDAMGNSSPRFDFLGANAGRATSIDDVQALLADRTVPLCVLPTPQRASLTFGSIAMQLESPPVMRIAPGPPVHTPWYDVAVKEASTA